MPPADALDTASRPVPPYSSGAALQTDLRALAPQLARERLIAVAFLQPIVQGALRELDHTVAEDPLLLAQCEIHQPISFNR
jgi:hypothetical protein